MSRKEERYKRQLRMIGQEDVNSLATGYNDVYMRKYFARLIMSQFDWKSDGENVLIDGGFIERTIYKNGFIAFRMIGETLTACPCKIGAMDFYDRPTNIEIMLPNGTAESITNDNVVVCFDNTMRDFIPTMAVATYTSRIANIDSAILVNIENLKTPVIIECDESQLLTMSDIFRQRKNNKLTIPVVKGTFDTNTANVLDLTSPNHINTFLDTRESLMNECLTMFGISCVDIRKRERLTSAEGESNNQRVELFLQSRLNERLRACEEIKQKFGVKMEVIRNGISNNGVQSDETGGIDMEE